MDVTEVLSVLGGVAERAEILRHVTRTDLDRAVRAGDVLRAGRGRYASPAVGNAALTARRMGGVLCRESAALHHGWAVKTVPDRPHVSVPRKRRLTGRQRHGVQVHRDDLHADDIDGVATSRELTLLQCLKFLPFDAALAVADSAARAGEQALLTRVQNQARGPGARQARRVAALASADAANPFESVLRAIALGVPGLSVRAQVTVSGLLGDVRPDLVDTDLRLVLEADSFEWHGHRDALRRDTRRYDALVAAGWIVLRFAYEDVMFDQDFVRGVLVAVVALADTRTHCSCCTAAPA